MKTTNLKTWQVLILFLFILSSFPGFGQAKISFPTIGKPMPEFTLNDVSYYTKNKISSADLKGKWYILDFWTRGCAPCIASFPKVSKMVEEFKGKVEIIEVGLEGNKEMREFYEDKRKKLGLNMPMAYDDKLAYDWQINSFPHIYIVDNKGVLRVITYDMSSEQLKSLMSDGTDTFTKKPNYKQYFANDVFKLYFRNNNGGNDTTFLLRSVLAQASPDYSVMGNANFNTKGPDAIPGTGDFTWSSITNLKQGMFQISKTPLWVLYNTAYFGQDVLNYKDPLYKDAVLTPSYKQGNVYPILEVKDSSDFKPDYRTLKGLYTYSLSMPKEKATRETMMRMIRLDLFKYFGYDARIETRKMPVWKLIISNKALAEKLRTKGGDLKTGIYEPSKWHLINGEISSIINNLFYKYQFGPTFIDGTGIDYNIDILLECSFKDLDCVKTELLKNGLDLIKTEKEMKVLVIRDPSETTKL